MHQGPRILDDGHLPTSLDGAIARVKPVRAPTPTGVNKDAVGKRKTNRKNNPRFMLIARVAR